MIPCSPSRHADLSDVLAFGAVSDPNLILGRSWAHTHGASGAWWQPKR